MRGIRDAIEDRVQTLIDEHLEEIRTDPTAHQMRLAQLLPELAREFDGQRAAEEIRACADAVLNRFDDATVRSHIITLALRETRQRVRQEPWHRRPGGLPDRDAETVAREVRQAGLPAEYADKLLIAA